MKATDDCDEDFVHFPFCLMLRLFTVFFLLLHHFSSAHIFFTSGCDNVEWRAEGKRGTKKNRESTSCDERDDVSDMCRRPLISFDRRLTHDLLSPNEKSSPHTSSGRIMNDLNARKTKSRQREFRKSFFFFFTIGFALRPRITAANAKTKERSYFAIHVVVVFVHPNERFAYKLL